MPPIVRPLVSHISPAHPYTNEVNDRNGDSRIERRIVLLDVGAVALEDDVHGSVVPGDEREVGDGGLAVDESAFALEVGEDGVEGGEDAEGLLVAFDGRAEVLRVVVYELERLPEPRAVCRVLVSVPMCSRDKERETRRRRRTPG